MAEFLFICSYNWNASLLVLSLVTLRYIFLCWHVFRCALADHSHCRRPFNATSAGRSSPKNNLDPAGSHQQRLFEHVVALLLQRGSATALGGG